MRTSLDYSQPSTAARNLPTLVPCSLSTANRLELLGAVEILQDLSEEDLISFVDGTRWQTAPRGAAVYGVDDAPAGLFLLGSGKVELYRLLPDGKKLTMAVLERGSMFGEASVSGQPFTGTGATAIEDSVVCTLSPQDVGLLVSRQPNVALRMVETLARELQLAGDALEEMAFYDVTGRVASLLLRLADEDTNVVEGYSHQDLAAMIGCLRESLTTTLDRFKRSNAVEIGRRRVEITDRSQLEQVISQRSRDRSP